MLSYGTGRGVADLSAIMWYGDGVFVLGSRKY